MVDSEQRVDVRLGFEVIPVAAMVRVELRQQGGVGRLRKFRLLVDQREDAQRLHRDHVQRFLVVDELDPTPVDRFVIVLLLQGSPPKK